MPVLWRKGRQWRCNSSSHLNCSLSGGRSENITARGEGKWVGGGHHSVPMFCFQNGLLISLHCFLFNSSTPESFVNILKYFMHWVSQVALVVKNPSASAGDTRDMGLIPGSGRSPGEGNSNPLQYSCLEDSHEQRSLVGYSLWGRKELDTTEATWHAHFIHELSVT